MYRKGFTLLEILIVVIIIGILAAIAMPQYMNTLEKARSGEAVANIGALRSSVDRYWYQRASLTDNLALYDIDSPNNQNPRLWTYKISGVTANASTRAYTIHANRWNGTAEDATTYVRWVQTNNTSGNLYKSQNLGGPTAP